MPTDNKGKFQMSGLRPGSDGKLPVGRANEKTMSALREPKATETAEGGKSLTVHDHGDGTFHTEHHDGTPEEQHPDHLHMSAHVAHHMEPEKKHFHTAHDGFEHQSHGVHEDGTHEGTDTHEDTDSLKGGMDKFLGAEQGEMKGNFGDTGSEQEEKSPLGGM